jgi:hypothetical protein
LGKNLDSTFLVLKTSPTITLFFGALFLIDFYSFLRSPFPTHSTQRGASVESRASLKHPHGSPAKLREELLARHVNFGGGRRQWLGSEWPSELCSASGNCATWFFRRPHAKWQLVLDGFWVRLLFIKAKTQWPIGSRSRGAFSIFAIEDFFERHVKRPEQGGVATRKSLLTLRHRVSGLHGVGMLEPARPSLRRALWEMAMLLFEQSASCLGETLAGETTGTTTISDNAIPD